MRPADGTEGIGAAVHEVGTVAAMDMQIDEAGGKIAPLQIDNISFSLSLPGNACDPPVLDDDRSFEQPIGQDERAVSKDARGHGLVPQDDVSIVTERDVLEPDGTDECFGRTMSLFVEVEVEVMTDEQRQTVLRIYDEVDRDVAAAGPVCVASGRCCRFKEYGHTLFLSNLEAEVLLAAAPPYDPTTVTPDYCPFQKGNLCTAREPRPLGCRIYYCDPNYQETGQLLSEQYLHRLKRLAEENQLDWRYAPLHVFLREHLPTQP
jgi:Fe-S-cluster containining protein